VFGCIYVCLRSCNVLRFADDDDDDDDDESPCTGLQSETANSEMVIVESSNCLPVV